MRTVSAVANNIIDSYRARIKKNELGRGVEPATLHAFLCIWKRLEPFYGDKTVVDIPKYWDAYKAWSNKNAPERSHRHDLIYLRQIINRALLNGDIPHEVIFSFTTAVKAMSLDKCDENREPDVYLYSPEEIGNLLDGARSKWKLFIYIASVCGMRFSEIRRLKWEYIDWDARVIRLPYGIVKIKKGRVVSLTDWLICRLKIRKERSRSPYIFPKRGDLSQPMTRNSNTWLRLKGRLGIDKRFHDLRHTNISVLIENNWPMEYISHSRGVTSGVIKRVYMHMKNETIERMNDSVEGVLIKN